MTDRVRGANENGTEFGLGGGMPTARIDLSTDEGSLGTGTVAVSGVAVSGTATRFTEEIRVGDVLRLVEGNGTRSPRVVREVISNELVVVDSAYHGISPSSSFLYRIQEPLAKFSSKGVGKVSISGDGDLALGSVIMLGKDRLALSSRDGEASVGILLASTPNNQARLLAGVDKVSITLDDKEAVSFSSSSNGTIVGSNLQVRGNATVEGGGLTIRQGSRSSVTLSPGNDGEAVLSASSDAEIVLSADGAVRLGGARNGAAVASRAPRPRPGSGTVAVVANSGGLLVQVRALRSLLFLVPVRVVLTTHN